MAKKSDWEFAAKAVEANDDYAAVTPGRVSKPRERILGHDETNCSACGAVVKLSNFICPHCSGKVRAAKPATNVPQLDNCWECKKPVGRSAKSCPHCGASQGSVIASLLKSMVWVFVLVVFVAFAFVIVARL